jgi:hypothetical protein
MESLVWPIEVDISDIDRSPMIPLITRLVWFGVGPKTVSRADFSS